MKTLATTLALLIALTITTPTNAQYSSQVSTNGLSDSQEAELALQARQMAAENEEAEKSIPPAERMQEYAEAGQAIAVALGACAEELGVAIEDFSKTPVGKVTIVILAWKLIGKDMLRVIIAPMFLLVGTTMWIRYFRKMCIIRSTDHHDNGKIKRTIYQAPNESDGLRFIMLIVITIIWTTGMLIMLL